MQALRDRMENMRWVRFLFLRGLGVTFGIAFASLTVQVRGLLGQRGILPAAEQLAQARRALGGVSLLRVPTLFWWGSSDAWLTGVCWMGVVLSLLLVAGVAQRWVLALLWVGYLSVMSVGGVFLRFQWDTLLLETALTALPLAPAALWRGRGAPAPSRASVLLVRGLLFKLMLLSGLVKLASGDETWRHFTALQFHFWTQPLPALPGWWLAHAPGWVLQTLCFVTLVIELLFPLGIWGPRSLRLISFGGLVALQLAIALTGNYGFFGLLTGVLCLSLLDDGVLRRWLPRLPLTALVVQRPSGPGGLIFVGALAGLSVLVSVERFVPLPDWVEERLDSLRPLDSMNAYGLFATMTRQREEIRVQGSEDGRDWHDYELRDKPGPLDRAPGYVQPHMPRLDWQMWFASLGGCRRNPWFLDFAQALLENRGEVTALLATNPFPRAPPRFLRSSIAPYTVTSLAEHRRTGAYWREGEARRFCPTLTLENGALRAASAL